MSTRFPLHDSIDVFTAARIARVSRSTIRRWCEERRVKAWKPAGRWRVDRSSLYAMIDAGSNFGDRENPAEYRAQEPRKDVNFLEVKLLFALLTASFLIASDGPQSDRWRGLVLDSTSPSDAVAAMGQPVTDKPDRLFIPAIKKWFTPGLNKKDLRKQSFKSIEGFEHVDLYYKDDKLVVIQLQVAKAIEPTALKNIYGLQFEPYIDGIMEGLLPQDFERNQGRTYPKNYPPIYSLVAVAEHSIISAGVANDSIGHSLLQSMGGRDTAGGGFPGKVKLVQLISRTLENRTGEDLLK